MNPKAFILERFHGDAAIALASANWVMLAGLALLGLAFYNFLVAYRIIGEPDDPGAATEWLARWREISSFERWTILHAYTRMDTVGKQDFQAQWIEQACRVYHEFTALENLVLMLRRDGWLVGEIYRAIEPPGDWIRHLPRVVKMTHLDRPVTAWQIVRRQSAKPMRNLGLMVFLVGLTLYLVVTV